MLHALPEGWNYLLPAAADLPFAPIGIGTARGESFTSALSRLSWERYWQPPGAFIYDRLAGALGRPRVATGDDVDRRAYFARILAFGPASLNGAGRYAATWRAATLASTGHDLGAGTALAWGGPALPPRRLLHPGRRVCSACLEEMRAQVEREEALPAESRTSSVHELLVWSFLDVEVCERHACALSGICPACGELLAVLSYRHRPGHCGRCDAWLGGRGAGEPVRDDEFSWQTWVIAQVGRIIELGPALVAPPTGAGIELVAARIVKECGGLKRLGGRIGRSKSVISYWRAGRAMPSFTAVLRASAVAGIDVAAFLHGRWEEAAVDRPRWIPTTSEKHQAHNYDEAELAFRRALEAEGEPPTATALLAASGIDRQSATRSELLAPLYRAVQARRKASIPVRGREAALRRADLARRAGAEMAAAGIPIKRRSLDLHVGRSMTAADLVIARTAAAEA